MPRKESKPVPEGNDGPVRQQEEFGSGQLTLAGVYRLFKQRFDQSDSYCDRMKNHFDQLKKLDEMAEEMRVVGQRVSSLEQDVRQPRLAMVGNGQADTKTHGRTEGTATAVQAMHGDSGSAHWVDPNPMCSTSFGGDCIGPPALPCSEDDALVGKGTAAPKSCLSPLEMLSPTAAGGLLPAGKTSTATKTTFHQLRL